GPSIGTSKPRAERVMTAIIQTAKSQSQSRRLSGVEDVDDKATPIVLTHLSGLYGVKDGWKSAFWRKEPEPILLYLRRPTMSEIVGLRGLHQVSRMVRDIEESTVFYRDVLGLRHLSSFGELAFFDLGG